jgi:hypothetical protein
MPEWPKGPDCKSGGIAFEGSNPSSPTVVCGRSSMVELQPSKLVVWVRFPSPALPAAVAQLVERFLGKDEVMGSSPISSLFTATSVEECQV